MPTNLSVETKSSSSKRYKRQSKDRVYNANTKLGDCDLEKIYITLHKYAYGCVYYILVSVACSPSPRVAALYSAATRATHHECVLLQVGTC